MIIMSRKENKSSNSERSNNNINTIKNSEKDMIERKKQTTEFGKDYYEQAKNNNLEPDTENE